MLALKTTAGVQHIWFGDDVFALNAAWVQQFAMEVTARNASVPFKIQPSQRSSLMRSIRSRRKFTLLNSVLPGLPSNPIMIIGKDAVN